MTVILQDSDARQYMLPIDVSAATNIAHTPNPAPDPGVVAVADWFQNVPGFSEKFGEALRQSFDEVLDGQRTGRFDINDLEKTEKTYLGTKVEIVVRAAFDLSRGEKMDYSVAKHEVDSKFTVGTNWTIPGEAQGHICLLMMASDHTSSFRIGLLRIKDEYLNPGGNRDGKRSISKAGRAAVYWLVPNGKLPENILMSITETDRNAIFDSGSGQARTNELFRRVQKRLVNRNTVVTVAKQEDSPKRVRDARLHLRNEGIVILGHQSTHRSIARELGLPVPGRSYWVAARLTPIAPGSDRPSSSISGTHYAVAEPYESAVPAPAI
ncbi:NaeI family type II restriction endonuclease [Streptomyces sp. NPDC050617]|uniref:NaeI family type II restriction endonuclease n=1 Tax=Streptomyces sp. NPDC050617 TaxID=3154628 RepID=UPI0034261FA2